jgi:hypothetical protein
MQITYVVVDVIGLALTAIGAAIAAWNVIVTDSHAKAMTSVHWNRREKEWKLLKAQCRGVTAGLALVFVGATFQAVAAALPLFG